jgi:hypothetical protein
MAYVEIDQLAEYLRSTIVADDPELEAASLAAESTINGYCQRVFTVPTAATTRTFVPDDWHVLTVPDIANTTGLVVTSDGSAVAASEYQLEISPGITGPIGVDGRTWPYTRIRLLSGSWPVDSDGEADVSITARWGWPAVPPEVTLATKLLARDFLIARDTSFGIVQVGDFSRRIAANGVVETLLAPLRRVESFGFA